MFYCCFLMQWHVFWINVTSISSHSPVSTPCWWYLWYCLFCYIRFNRESIGKSGILSYLHLLEEFNLSSRLEIFHLLRWNWRFLNPKILIEDPEYMFLVYWYILIPYHMRKRNSFLIQSILSLHCFISFWAILTISYLEQYKKLWPQRPWCLFFLHYSYCLEFHLMIKEVVDLFFIIINRNLSYLEYSAAVDNGHIYNTSQHQWLPSSMSDWADSSDPLTSFTSK